jgi:hypothetical protein
VARSNLSDANEKRDWRIYRDLANALIVEARRLYVNDAFGGRIVCRGGRGHLLGCHRLARMLPSVIGSTGSLRRLAAIRRL